MDLEPPDHFQMPCPMIKLQSSDGEIFQVEVKVARLSLHLKAMMDDLGVEENEVISIPENGPKISGAILQKIIDWAKHHKNDPADPEDNEKDEKPVDDAGSWDAEFLKVDQATLFQMIRAANYLNIEGLLDITCKEAAKMIKGKTVREVRQIFNIPVDFSPDEEKQVLKEYTWFEGISFREQYGLSAARSVANVKSTSMDSVQNMDNEDREVIEGCLQNSVVLRKIFQHLSDTELLKLSFVNKTWNYEARSVIRKQGNLFAHVRCCGYRFDADVKDFLATTKQMNVVPFSEIEIHIGNHQQWQGFPNETSDPFYKLVLDHLKLKKVSLYLSGDGHNYGCPALLLAKKVLEDYSEVLEALSLHIYDEEESYEQKYNRTDRQNYFEDVMQECRFPLLKVLKMRKLYDNSDVAYIKNMKELVSRAPRLQELHTTAGSINAALNALEGSSAVILCISSIQAPFSTVPQAAVGVLRLSRADLLYFGPWFNFDRFNEIAPALLQASSTTIRSMRIDTVLAVPLMCYGVSLKKVESLSMRILYRHLELHEPRILGIVKHFDFTRTFPNLKKVEIFQLPPSELSPDHMNQIVERANALLPDPKPDRAAYVKELNLRDCNICNATVQFLAEMFPSIEKLEVKETREEEFPFGSIWRHWVDLKELEVSGEIIPRSGNLDSVFCGIFPEEIAELRQKDEEFLKRVHIVPVMPAITCLKNLKRLSVRDDRRWHWVNVDNGTLMFSKVTGLIAFARCPSLMKIMLGGMPENAARHMEPFASIGW